MVLVFPACIRSRDVERTERSQARERVAGEERKRRRRCNRHYKSASCSAQRICFGSAVAELCCKRKLLGVREPVKDKEMRGGEEGEERGVGLLGRRRASRFGRFRSDAEAPFRMEAVVRRTKNVFGDKNRAGIEHGMKEGRKEKERRHLKFHSRRL